MRRPAGVGDADGAVCRRGVDSVLQALDLTDGAHALQLTGTVEHGDTRRVVTTVLESLQPLDEDGDDITLRYGADDAAHESKLPLFEHP